MGNLGNHCQGSFEENHEHNFGRGTFEQPTFTVGFGKTPQFALVLLGTSTFVRQREIRRTPPTLRVPVIAADWWTHPASGEPTQIPLTAKQADVWSWVPICSQYDVVTGVKGLEAGIVGL